ncbi:MAG TPA: hypothetical protein VM451_04195 [Candidatus Limnocylindria bacterium]|nr:hypothetical protein [Candidatus Limnocylindria bacterium]
MGLVMDLVAGDSREILLAVAVDDLAAFSDRGRFKAHLSFGGSIDPTWLDLFSQAARAVTNRDDPIDFLEARNELEGPGDGGERTVERIDSGWITAIAMIDDRDVDAITGRWIDLLEDELGELAREEKPSVRKFATEIVEFARRADRAPAVILAWSL